MSQFSANSTDSKSIAIIGAGMAGIAAAQELSKIATVTVFEKSRGFGGRMATRKHEAWQFDHGAQFFTARSNAFQNFLSAYIDSGLVKEWQPKVLTLDPTSKPFKREWFEPHFVAVPGMNALAKEMASELDVRLNVEVADLEQSESHWILRDKEGEELGAFDWVISSAPAPQSLALLPEAFVGREQIESVVLSPCFALMLGFNNPLNLNFDAAVVRNSPIAWIAVDSAKPAHEAKFSLLIHSDNQWATENLDCSQEEIGNELLTALSDLLDEKFVEPKHINLHRWRYARAEESLKRDSLIDSTLHLACCGDWCMGNRVEDAYLSGLSVAREVLDCVQNN